MAIGTMEVERLSTSRLKDLENQLFSLNRTQARRQTPVDLPSPFFWDFVTQLVQHIEVELEEIVRRDGWGAKSQLLQRRQGNVRRAISDLTRNRLNAFAKQATMSRLVGDDDASSGTSGLDWARHSPHERAFHDSVARLVDRYKADVDWTLLQSGVIAAQASPVVAEPGVAPLDSFTVDAGGAGGSPRSPTVTDTPMTDTPEPAGPVDTEFDDDDFDLEPEPFQEFEEMAQSGLDNEQETSDSGLVDKEGNVVDAAEDDEATDAGGDRGELRRIRMIRDLDEPLIDASGDEIELLAGDVHQCAELLAETLIAAGVAEDAPL